MAKERDINILAGLTDFLKLSAKSLLLDARFFTSVDWPSSKKLIYLKEKYRIKFKHFFRPFYLGKDFARLNGRQLFYDSKFGLSGHQNVLVNDLVLIKKAKLTNIKTVIDIGANVGYLSLGISEQFPRSSIHSIEPIPETYEVLKKNTEHKPQITAYDLAISDKKGDAKMSFDPNDTVFSKVVHNGKGKTKVSTETLDEFIKSHKISSIDLLSIDTETYELNVLKGATHALSISRYLLIEVTVLNNKSYSFTALMKLLSTDAYDYQLIAYKDYSKTPGEKITFFDLILINNMARN